MRALEEDAVSRVRSGREQEGTVTVLSPAEGRMVVDERTPMPCAHLVAQPLTPRPADFEPYCQDCALTGDQWVELRRCLTCDHVACCDESPNQHATRHFRSTDHPVITSAEPGETWRWCYLDEEVAA